MGRFKPLLPFGGKPLLAHVIESVQFDTSIAPIVVVTGHNADALAAVLGIYSVHEAHNPAYAGGGMLSSIQTGLAAVKGQADAVLIALGDQPMVRRKTVRSVVSAWTERRPRVVLPTHRGKHGHPILLSAEGIDEILALPAGESTLKTYTDRQVEHTLDWNIDDPAILYDLDTPDEYAAALTRWERERTDDPHDPDISVRSPSCPSPSKAH